MTNFGVGSICPQKPSKRVGDNALHPGKPGRWRRWIADPVAAQLTQGVTAEKISLSLAVGSLCAFFPVLGAATPLCFVAGGALRLNQAIIQAINGVTAPAYFFVVLALARIGGFLLGSAPLSLDPRTLAALWHRDPVQCLHRFGTLGGHAVLGWMALAPFWIVAGYYGLVPVLRAVTAAARARAAAVDRAPRPCAIELGT